MNDMNVFLISFATFVFSTVFVLSLLNEQAVDVYVALFMIEFFIASELVSPLSAAEHRKKTIVETMMLIVFAAIVIGRIVQILG